MSKNVGCLKRVIALLLCVVMMFSMNGISALAEAEDNQVSINSDVTDSNLDSEAESVEPENAEIENTKPENTEPENTEIGNTESENTETESTETESTETESTEPENTKTDNTEAVTANMLLNYLVLGSSYLETPAEQYVLAGIGDGTYAIESAVLHYKNDTTNAEYTVTADVIDEDGILFYMNFYDDSFTGCYRITAIDYITEGVSGTIDIKAAGIDAEFGVNCKVVTEPDAKILDTGDLLDSESVVVTDDQGNSMTATEFGNALESSASGISNDGSVNATGAGTLIIVLDPGHGGTDSGAYYSGIKESDLNLKIAAYCKQELDKYTGVKVYMTRTTDETMGASQAASLDERVRRATAYKADVLVSFHINANTNTSANGAAVYYPNSNYNTSVYNTGRDLAAKIQQKLVALGIKNNGTIIWNAEIDKYPDGSAADYLGIIRRSKLAGYPCVLIEHAFLSNSEDVSNYLNSDEKLKKLGIADAAGIAEYYNLKKKSSNPTMSYISGTDSETLKISWSKCEGVDGYQLYRAASEKGTYKKVAVLSGAAKTTYTDTGLTAGETYYYKVRSVTGGSTGSFSKVMSAYPLNTAAIKSVKSKNSGSLTVSWESISGAAGYQLYRSTDANGSYTKLAEINSGSATSYTDTSVTAGTNYYYILRVYNKQNGKTCSSSDSAAATGWSIKAAKISGVNSQENGALLIKWGSVKNIYRYEVYRSGSKNGTYKKIATVKTNSYEDTAVNTNTSYYYKIRTVNRVGGVSGYGSYSAVKTGKQIAKTSISSILATSDTQVKLTWKSVSGATGYQIYRSTSKNGTYKLVKTITKGTTTSFTNKKLTTGKTYYYKVQVLNKVGSYSGCSELSKAASAKMLAKTDISYIQTVNDTKLKVVWETINGAAGYQVARSTAKNGSYQVIATITSGTAKSYTDKTVKAGKTYYYKVSVTSKNKGTSGYSEIASGKTAKTTTITTVQPVSAASLQVTWKKSSGASGYIIYRSSNETSGYSKIATVKSAVTLSYTDTPPKTNTTYYYKIRSYNKNNGKTGYSNYSKAVNGKALAVPKMNAVTQNANGSLKISWKKVGGAQTYRIYRKAGTGSYKKLKEVKSTVLSYEDTGVTAGIKYSYKVQAYNKVNGIQGSSGYSAVKTYVISYTEIMGESGVTAAQMVKYYNAGGRTYPSFYQNKGAATVADLAQIVLEEAAAEGVKAEVVWTQMCKETGFLEYGGQVKIEQCNFCGLGATDGGAAGADFSSYSEPVRMGIRAQVQHLKAYATDSSVSLQNECVDPRFDRVKRGMAKYVEWLGIQENPNTERDALGNVVYVTDENGKSTIKNGCGWATDKNYGFDLVTRMNTLKAY